MVLRGTVRASASLVLALLTLALSTAAVSAAGECTVDVAPAAGPAGSVFVFSGTGFVPTRLELSKDDRPAGTHTIVVDDEDPWEFAVRSRPKDEGVWTAEFVSDDCYATADFRVTLSNTDTASDLRGPTPVTPMPMIAFMVLLGAGTTGGVMLGRRLQPAARDNQ